MRSALIVVCALSLGCEAIAGYDSREPWSAAAGDGSTSDATTPDDASIDASTDASTDGTSPEVGQDTGPPPCLAPNTRCGEACVDLAHDFDHCGACDAPCPESAICTTDGLGTRCVCPGTQIACGSGTSAACVDPSTDREHCGGCGKACGAGEICSGGTCVCSPEVTTCGATCKDTRADSLACGACDAACSASEYCAGSTCKCRPGLALCESECVDTKNDPRHCGGCGKTCGSSCRDGTCKPTCDGAGSRTSCPLGSGDACVDTQTDPQNCGACGKACATNELCVAGACKAYAPAIGCTACPCAACDDLFETSKCCPALPSQPLPICVSGAACP